MKKKITVSLLERLLILFLLLLPLVQTFAQTRIVGVLNEYDNSTYTASILPPKTEKVVDNPTNVNVVDENFARLKASPGVAIGLGGFSSFIELKFPNTLKANQTSFIRIKTNDNLLKGLLGGSLGNALSGVLGAVLVGGQELEITAANGTTNILTASSTNSFSTSAGRIKIVQDSQNEYYLAITPNVIYDRIRIKNKTDSLLGIGVIKNLDVYHAFTYENGNAVCGKPFSTSFDGNGLNLTLLSANDPKLSNAIDNDPLTHSTLNVGGLLTLNVSASFSQIFYFPTSSDEKASVNISLAITSNGLLNLNLLGGVEVSAYNGNNIIPVYQKSLSGGLLADTNVLNLIQSGQKATLVIAPQKSFDRIVVSYKVPAGVNVLGASVNIYDVERYDGVRCPNPLITIPSATTEPFEVASCASTLGAYANVDFALNAVDGNNETFATLTAFNGNILVTGPQSGSIELKHANTLPANTTSYVRIDADKDLLNNLLGGTLGKLVGDLGGVLLGNHVFSIEAFDSTGTSVLNSSSSNSFEGTTNGTVKLVQDNIGRYYFAITPNQAYQSVQIKNSISSLLPTGANAHLNVYNMCTEIGTDLCYPAQFTSYTQSGLTLGVADLANAGVANPYYAIDASSSSYSEIKNGLVSVAGSVNQTIYFNKTSKVGDQLKVRLQVDPSSILDLNLLGRYTIVTSLGKDVKETFTLQQGLVNNIDLLGLFKSGGIQSLTFDTTQAFDRVDIVVSSIVSASVTPSLRVYEVKRISTTCPEVSSSSPFIQPVCATTIVESSNADDLANLFDDNFDSYATLKSGAGTLLGLGNKYEGYVELAYDKTVPANTTSYIRIDFDETLLNALLGGSLGNIVNGLLNGIALGDHFFSVDVKDANNASILKAQSNSNAGSTVGTGSIKVVRDKLGRTYLAVTPTQAYKAIRITDHTNSLLGLLAEPNTMNVYGMCYETSANSCVPSLATAYEFEGLALTVSDLSGAGVKYPERAIDDNTTNYSEISLGTLNIAGSVRQNIYFNTKAKAGEITDIKFKTAKGAVNVGLIGAIEIIAFDGENKVDELVANNGLINGINVLDLLTNGKMVNLPFAPKAAYNRISVGLKQLVNVNVGSDIHLYDVSRSCHSVTDDQQLVVWKSYKVNGDATIKTVKGGEQIQYMIHVRNITDANVNGFIIKDKIPAGTTFVSSPLGQLSANNELEFSYPGLLVPNATVTFTFIVDVDTDLSGKLEIKNIAYAAVDGQIAGEEVFYPSLPPLDNVNPTDPDIFKQPGTIIKIVSDGPAIDKPVIIAVDEDGNEIAINTICEGSFITLKVKDAADTYQWYYNGIAIDNSNSGSTDPNILNYGKMQTLSTHVGGDYSVIVTKATSISPSSDVFVLNTTTPPVIDVNGNLEISVFTNDMVTYPVLTSPNGVIQWYDKNGIIASNQLPQSFAAPGVYVYTAVVDQNGCTSSETIIVTVSDRDGCPPFMQRVYAKNATDWVTTLAGAVSNQGNAIDGNPTTHSTITLGVSLLGLGTTWQNIYFDKNTPVPAGTPVSIKLGNEYSVVAVGDGLTVVGLDAKGNDIGVVKSVDGGLLKLLNADNVYEYTFVPSNNKGPQPYYGVRVVYSAAIGVGASTKIYGAYYNAPADACIVNPIPDPSLGINEINPSVLDIHHGIQTYVLNAATALAPFVDPWKAVDNDPNSYAYINKTVSVANAAVLTVIFKQQSLPTDELHLDMEIAANPVLSLDLLKGISIQRYLGDKKVGNELEFGLNVVGLRLLGLGNSGRSRVIVAAFDEPYDRVKIISGTAVSLFGESARIYNVSLNPKVLNEDNSSENPYNLCKGGLLSFTIDGCTDYKLYLNRAADGTLTNEVMNVNREFDLSSKLPLGVHPIYIQTLRNGCIVGDTQEIFINHTSCEVKSNLNITTKIK